MNETISESGESEESESLQGFLLISKIYMKKKTVERNAKLIHFGCFVKIN